MVAAAGLAAGCASGSGVGATSSRGTPTASTASTAPSASTAASAAAGTPALVHLLPDPLPTGLQVVAPQANPLDPMVVAIPRFARLFTGPGDSLLYVDAEATDRANWQQPTPGPGETLVHLQAGPGVLTTYSPNADQILYNRIGTVFDDRVPAQRAGGAVLLWTDGTLDYYGVALNIAGADQLLLRVAGSVRPASGVTFALASPSPELTPRFAGDPSGQWRSTRSPLSYGLVTAGLGEIDVTVTTATPGFVEALLGPPAVAVHGHQGWLLASQSAFGMASYTLFWYETRSEVVILSSDGRTTRADLLAFADSLAPVDGASWARLSPP